MKEKIDILTENGKYAEEICLLFLANNDDLYLEYLLDYNIVGKKLETFAYKCCHDCNIDFMKETVLCISLDLFKLDLVHKNLESENPIPFIEKLRGSNEGYVATFTRYYRTFMNNMDKMLNNNKKR